MDAVSTLRTGSSLFIRRTKKEHSFATILQAPFFGIIS